MSEAHSETGRGKQAHAHAEKAKHKPSASKIMDSDEDRIERARETIKKHATAAAAAALIPLPGADLAALVAVQVRMLSKLSQIYGRTFSESWAKHLIAMMLAEVGGLAAAGSLAKLFPPLALAAQLVGPASAGAVTLALGRVFHQHYASGGTLLDFDPAEAQRRFKLALANK